jgi:hypothetical protein
VIPVHLGKVGAKALTSIAARTTVAMAVAHLQQVVLFDPMRPRSQRMKGQAGQLEQAVRQQLSYFQTDRDVTPRCSVKGLMEVLAVMVSLAVALAAVITTTTITSAVLAIVASLCLVSISTVVPSSHPVCSLSRETFTCLFPWCLMQV